MLGNAELMLVVQNANAKAMLRNLVHDIYNIEWVTGKKCQNIYIVLELLLCSQCPNELCRVCPFLHNFEVYKTQVLLSLQYIVATNTVGLQSKVGHR